MGWHVMVHDLGSTNGSTVALLGEAPKRLAGHDWHVVEPGAVITLAGEIGFTYEAMTTDCG